jgi:hypothetical protein
MNAHGKTYIVVYSVSAKIERIDFRICEDMRVLLLLD